MKLCVVVRESPRSTRNNWFVQEIEKSFSPCAILTVRPGPTQKGRVERLLKKNGRLRAIRKIGAAALYRHYTSQISSAQEAHFRSLVPADFKPRSPQVPVGTLRSKKAKEWFAKEKPDVTIPIAGGIIKPELLALSTFIRWHHGITPDIRGIAAPYWTIYHDRPEWLGVTVQELVKELDEGEILAQRRIVPEPTDDLATVHRKLDEECLSALLQVLHQWEDGSLVKQACNPSEGVYRSSPTIRSLLRFPLKQRRFFRRYRS